MIILTSHHPLSHLPPTPLGPSFLTNMSPSYSQDFVLFWYDPVSLWSIAYTNMGGAVIFKIMGKLPVATYMTPPSPETISWQ